MVWYGVAWRGVACHDVVWHGMAWHGMAWHGMAWHGMAWHGMAWHGMALYGMLWCGVVWYFFWVVSRMWVRPLVNVQAQPWDLLLGSLSPGAANHTNHMWLHAWARYSTVLSSGPRIALERGPTLRAPSSK